MKIVNNLVLIPSRIGSKRVKNKNFIILKKKKLYEHSLQHAYLIKKKFKSTIIALSTDYVGKLKKKNYFDIIKRPKDISGDKSKSKEYILHTLSFYKKKKIIFKNVVILQPTCPIRSKKDLIECIKIFTKKKVNSLISVYKETYVNDSVKYLSKNKLGLPVRKDHNHGTDGKKNKDYFVRNGSIYITSINYFLKTKNVISDRPYLYQMNKINSINIDTIEDLNLIKKFI